MDQISIDAIRDAQKRISKIALRTPLVRLDIEDTPAEIYLKLENLQPIGSFKIRGAGNAMLKAKPEELSRGVLTASAGNMAQGVAWNARLMGIPCTFVVPDHAPETKLTAISRLGGKIIKVPFDEWWQVILTKKFVGVDDFFLHPVVDEDVIAGNGTIALEILEDLPDVDSVLVPYGGGGLSCGIASAFRALKPQTRIFACEVETAAPFAASLQAGKPVEVNYTPSFVDGIGGKSMLPEMWPLASTILNGSVVVSVAQIAEAIRILMQRARVVAEGAGAASLAAALTGRASGRKIVCVISGGNIDSTKLIKILDGSI